MAFTKEEKKALVEQYERWLKESRAVFVLSYQKMPMQMIDQIRAEARESEGEVHVVKNTLMNLALQNAGMEDEGLFDGTSIVGFAFKDAPSMAKLLNKAAKDGDSFAFKGGYLDSKPIVIDEIITLAELPPMPQMRAQLLAMIAAPASQLVRTISEPARGLAAVLKVYSEKPSAAVAN